MESLRRALVTFDPRGPALSTARSLLGLAQLTILLLNPDVVLFPFTPQAPDGVRCDGLREASLWCLGASALGWPAIARALAIVVLALVVAGYRPRWLCVPHCYVAFSLNAALPFANGGEQVAQILAMLLVPICLADERGWHWSRPFRQPPPGWRGAGLAAHLILRLQASVIYLWAGASKLSEPQWRDGTAMHAIAHQPGYGFPTPFLRIADTAFSWFPALAAVTWGAVATEIAIGLLVLGSDRLRRAALLAGIVLHMMILILMGLPSFCLIMIALLSAVWAGGTGRTKAMSETGAMIAHRESEILQ